TPADGARRMTRKRVTALALALVACGASGEHRANEQAPAPDASSERPPADAGAQDAPPDPCSDDACVPAPADVGAPEPLQVRFVGVAGFLLERGGESILTAPLFTRPSMIEVSTGIPVTANGALTDAALSPAMLANVRAIVTGHAHYDHLLDTPE